MKRLISALLSFGMILSLCNGFALSVHAANGNITAAAVETYTKSETAQDVVIRLAVSGLTENYCAFYIDTGAELPEGFEIKSFTTNNEQYQIKEADYNAELGTLNYDPVSSENSLPISTYFDVVISAPANAHGEYPVTFVDVCATDAAYEPVAEAERITATLTITDDSSGSGTPAAGYTATIANGTAAGTVRVGDTIYVNVGSNKDFAATEMTISYNPSLVKFNKAASTLGNATVTDNSGLQLADYGANKTAAANNYVLAFTAISDGTAPFTVTYAAFGTGTSAETANLTEAAASAQLDITIAKKQHEVTLPNIFAGVATVVDGEDYTFTKESATGAYYDYELPTATMVEGEQQISVTVTGDADTGWTIADVTGDLVISGTRAPKKYNVTVNGEGNAAEEKVTLPAGQPTYLTDYTFTIPADKAAGTEPGYTYALTSVTINGFDYSFSTTNEGKSCTIPGTAIIGNVVITVTKTVTEANKFTVTKTGEGAGDAAIAASPVAKDGDAVLTLTKDALYKYTVSATMGGETAEVTESGNTYTVSNVTANVVFTVTKTLNIESAKVQKYIQQDGNNLWLVTINGTGTEQISGKTYSFNGSNMYWSSQYKCYVTLVEAAAEPVVTTGFALVDVNEVPSVAYDMDVNNTDGTVDANDAQLVWNMYKPVYSGFTANVTIDKYLEADVNGDKTVDVKDAVAIINSILGLSNN